MNPVKLITIQESELGRIPLPDPDPEIPAAEKRPFYFYPIFV
jgi:hypothetical protein